MKLCNMVKDNKKRLFEVFQKVNKINLKEWYDDAYAAVPEKIDNINPNDINQVREFHTYLMVDGIEDIYDYWKPRWMIDELKNNGYIAEDPQSYAWFFTEEGKQKFSTPQDLQNWILGQWNSVSSGNDSEAPYLRGNEMDESIGLPMGVRVKVSDGSGLDSNKEGVVVSPREVKTDGRGVPVNVQGAYKPVDWKNDVAVRLDDGSLITMFKNRLNRI